MSLKTPGNSIFQQSADAMCILHTLLTCGGLYICFLLARAFYRVYFHPLSRYPGPFVAAFSKPWYIRPFRSNIPSLPSVLTNIGMSGTGTFTKDSSFYDFVTFPGTSIGETDPANHRIRCLVLAPAFSPSRVQELAPMVKRNVDLLLKRFESFATDRKPVNVYTSTTAFTMDVISKIVFGKELGCIQDPPFRNQFIEYLHSTFEMGWPATAFPNLTRFSLSLPEWLSESLFPIPLMEFKKARNSKAPKCTKLIENYLQDRNVPVVGKAAKLAKNDFNKSIVIDAPVDPSSVKDHSILNASLLAEEVIMLLSAGNDTTSNALISGIYQILKNPAVDEKLSHEIITAFPHHEDEITYDKAKRLPYLSAVIKEILRFSNPFPGRVPRLVPPEGYDLYGHHLPPDTILVTSSYLLNRHQSLWSDPYNFNPNRWLDPDAASLDKYMTSFYRGTRQCLGKDLALCERHVLLGNLFRNFKLEIYNTTDEDMKWIDLLLTYFTGKNFEVILEKRGT